MYSTHYQLMFKDKVISNHKSLITAARAWFAYCKGKAGSFGHPDLWIRDFTQEKDKDVTHEAHEALEAESKGKS